MWDWVKNLWSGAKNSGGDPSAKDAVAPIFYKTPNHPLLTDQGLWRPQSPRLVVLTGAGLSVASGMQTFRGDKGVWNGQDINQVCNFHTWRDNPAGVHAFYDDLRARAHRARPNQGHAVLQRLTGSVVLVTQNVDGLLERAGKNRVLNVHGQLNRLHCVLCHHQWNVPWSFKWTQTDQRACPFCGLDGGVKPGIVMFHEAPPLYKPVLNALYELTPQDVVAVVGTSGEVLPLKNWLGFCPAHKWLFNLERSAKLPEHMFDVVHWGAFEKTSAVLEDLWSNHQEIIAARQRAAPDPEED